MNSFIKRIKGGLELKLYIQPGASQAGFAGLMGERLKLKVSAPPREGEANQALIDFLCRQFRLKKADVEIFRGEKSRMKDIRLHIQESSVGEIEAFFEELLQAP